MQEKLDTIGGRLAYVIKKSGFDRGDFAQAIDIHYETLGKHLRENTLPKKKMVLQQIVSVTGYSVDWISTGEGPMDMASRIESGLERVLDPKFKSKHANQQPMWPSGTVDGPERGEEDLSKLPRINLDVGVGAVSRNVIPMPDHEDNIEYYVRITVVGLTKEEGEVEKKKLEEG